jgi:hypothetical protein
MNSSWGPPSLKEDPYGNMHTHTHTLFTHTPQIEAPLSDAIFNTIVCCLCWNFQIHSGKAAKAMCNFFWKLNGISVLSEEWTAQLTALYISLGLYCGLATENPVHTSAAVMVW